ncbi:MAG: L,D-transpeptidase family protein [Pseudomonadota bacterium]
MLLAPVAQAKSVRQPERIAVKADPDTLLISIYKDLASNHLSEAQSKADALVQAFPNFHLGHLIRGDLLLMHTQPVTALGGAATGAPVDKLKDLRDEAMVRLKSLSARPNPELAPRNVLQLRDDQRFVFVVDAKQSRLYVYQNQSGQLKFVTDYYITQGKLGVNKLKEGDQKTPLGVYYITGRVSQAKLPPFYGAGALRINYPNEWDKLNGRSGSGIWLHGTPFDSYSRPPLASDGCVVLTNADLKQLNLSVEIGKTPVIISDHVEFVDKNKWNAERNGASQMVDAWRHDIESMDPQRVLKNYSAKFRSAMGEDLHTWFEKYKGALSGANAPALKLSEMTLFRYPGREDVIVGTFTQETTLGRSKSSIRKRQYWAKEGQAWKIVYESNM